MGRPRNDAEPKAAPKRPPAGSPQERENQLINLAVDLAEKQLRAGTASSQVVTHFLKLATGREQLERVKLEHENELLRARTENMQSSKGAEEMYAAALKAMRSYQGESIDEDFSD